MRKNQMKIELTNGVGPQHGVGTHKAGGPHTDGHGGSLGGAHRSKREQYRDEQL